MKGSLVSVIVPTYNAESTIRQCINSIASQSYSNIEVIIVNDGSTDNTKAIVDEIARNDKRISFLTQKNGGVSAARNTGINKSCGKYVVFCDADDRMDSELIEQLLAYEEKDTLTGAKIIKQKGVHLEEACEKEYHTDSDYFESIFRKNEVSFVNGFLFEKNKIGSLKFDTGTSYMEDTLFLVQYIKNNKIKLIHHVNNRSNYYHTHTPTSLTRKNNEKRINGYFYSLDKINEILGFAFSKDIENDKIRILENEFIRSANRATNDKLKIEKYQGFNVRYRLFSFLYRNGRDKALKKYAKIIDIIHAIKK